MIDFNKISTIWFVGIGGIGMSALARYFSTGGFVIGGYDRTSSAITASLEKEGCRIIYIDNPGLIDKAFRSPDETLVVYTPAIPGSNKILDYFRDSDFVVTKRAEILGMISARSRTIAIAGTHGKTSVSATTAHILKQSDVDCSAFLGGISKNYQTNMLLGESNFMVMEADEYDRSFHHLSPEIALITSLDADHLDVYGDYNTMLEAYNIFISGIKDGGSLIINEKIKDKLRIPSRLKTYTYGFNKGNDFVACDIEIKNRSYCFSIKAPELVISDIMLLVPGRMNIENSLAAIALSLIAGVSPEYIRKAMLIYQGVKRRFDVRINTESLVYIDDYAHHPEELNYCISSVKEFYKDRKICGIFQPHLYTRTRDHAEAFARSLDRLDSVFILPVYPAREEAIEGVSSEMILNNMKLKDKQLITKEEVLAKIKERNPDILLSIGAGDIDRLVGPIEKMLLEGGI